MKINMIIPAKGTSERLLNKNLSKINDKTLVEIACERALSCKNINEVYLDTESDEIIYQTQHLQKNGLKIIKRHKSLANNEIGANDMMIYGLHSISECDILLQSFSTSPMIKSQTIDSCIEKFILNYDKFDSFFTVCPIQEYFWNKEDPINFSSKKLPNSFELEKMFMETHGLYGIKTESLLENKTRVGKNSLKIEISKLESLDINDYEDLEIARRLFYVSK